MAVVLEFNLICKDIIDLDSALQNSTISKLNISIEKISSIDNWMWENQKRLQDMSLVESVLADEKIIVVNLKSPVLKDLGIYMEKIREDYVYNLWINMDGYSNMDTDNISSKNRHYFKKFYQVFGEEVKKQSIQFRILGIGLETKFQYEKKNSDIIQNSENIIAWIVNKDFKDDRLLNNYKKNEFKGMNFLVFEK